jgi:uncharacterized Fe-S cluster-containing radical SAM superfamily protein
VIQIPNLGRSQMREVIVLEHQLAFLLYVLGALVGSNRSIGAAREQVCVCVC